MTAVVEQPFFQTPPIELQPNAAIIGIARTIHDSCVDFRQLRRRVLRGDPNIRSSQQLQGLLAEEHVSSVLRTYGDRVQLDPIPDGATYNDLYVHRTERGNIKIFNSSGTNPIEIDGLIRVDGVVFPYAVKAAKRINEDISESRIRKVINFIKPFLPGEPLGSLLIAPQEAFEPWKADEPPFITVVDQFRMQGGITASLPEPLNTWQRAASL